VRIPTFFRIASLLAVPLLVFACGGGSGATPQAASRVTGTIEVTDQALDGSIVTVASAEIHGAHGWIAIHEDVDGAPGPVVLGTAMVSEGSNNDVEVTLDQRPTASVVVWPMLHVDDHMLGAYEFGTVEGADLPVPVGGEIAMKRVQLTVA